MSFTINAPSSKSYAQRAIAVSALAGGCSVLRGVGSSEDTRAAIEIVRSLGAGVVENGDTLHITGGIGPLVDRLNIGEAGLATRLFTPIVALWDRPITIDGRGSILARPMDMMVGPLERLGVRVSSNGGCLPLTVCGPLAGGRTIEIDGSISSQFITGLLTALPLVDGDTILVVNNLQSKPYVDMTIQVLADFGVKIDHSDYRRFTIRGNQRYRATDYTVEGDWSGASCLLVLQAISGLDFRVGNLNMGSAQADRAILEAIELSGSDLRGFDFDATHCPDLFPALVALASHCRGASVIAGASRLTHKESDRAVALRDEFAKLGISIDISDPNVMIVKGGQVRGGAAIDPHGDHRIAMACAVAAWDQQVEILHPEVVNKSYPAFWSDLQKVGLVEPKK